MAPDDVVEEVVKQRLDQHDWNYGFILDGFPRNSEQGAFFLESYDIDAVLLIEVPDAVVQERILNRRLCPKCGLDYNLIFHRPAVANTCDICGGVLMARPDDTPEAVQARLQDYHTKTQPILELFRRKELVVIVDGTRSAAEVHQELRHQFAQKSERGMRSRLKGFRHTENHKPCKFNGLGFPADHPFRIFGRELVADSIATI